MDEQAEADFIWPDLTERPATTVVERQMQARPSALYHAFTEGWERWFAVPGRARIDVGVGRPFFWETKHAGRRHPHYGRFLKLVPDRQVQLTWVTGAAGTEGAETVLTVDLAPSGDGTRLRLTHAGFYQQYTADLTGAAWRDHVLPALDTKIPS
ncbi:MAG TPA: SRPBCC domain-containing protein [Devosia sp.]|nr:SRPBCC domain-containing protein [Devosia sp.]